MQQQAELIATISMLSGRLHVALSDLQSQSDTIESLTSEISNLKKTIEKLEKAQMWETMRSFPVRETCAEVPLYTEDMVDDYVCQLPVRDVCNYSRSGVKLENFGLDDEDAMELDMLPQRQTTNYGASMHYPDIPIYLSNAAANAEFASSSCQFPNVGDTDFYERIFEESPSSEMPDAAADDGSVSIDDRVSALEQMMRSLMIR